MRLLAAMGCALLAASCTGAPAVVTSAVPPGIAPGARTFAVAPVASEAARQAVPVVEERLEAFGFRRSLSPDLLVTVAVNERPRNVGAFTSATCNTAAWPVPPRKAWLVGGGRVQTLSIIISDAKTDRLLYRSAASLRTGTANLDVNLGLLVSSALGADPRSAPAAIPAC